MAEKEVTARIKISKLLETAWWRFFATATACPVFSHRAGQCVPASSQPTARVWQDTHTPLMPGMKGLDARRDILVNGRNAGSYCVNIRDGQAQSHTITPNAHCAHTSRPAAFTVESSGDLWSGRAQTSDLWLGSPPQRDRDFGCRHPADLLAYHQSGRRNPTPERRTCRNQP